MVRLTGKHRPLKLGCFYDQQNKFTAGTVSIIKAMKSISRLFFLLIFGICVTGVKAQVPELIRNPEFRQDAQAAVDSLYNFNFEGAEQRLSEWQKKYPDHPLWKLFDAMAVWWKVLSDLESREYDRKLVRLMKKANYAASRLLQKQPRHADALIIKAIANGYIARHYANRGDWLTSINYGRTAIQAYQYLQKVVPHLPDLKLAKGLKLYYAAYLPEAYPVVKTVSWFLPDGNKKKGLKLLKQASQQAIFASAEATYFLGNIYFNYEHKPAKAIHYFRRLYEQYPRNNYYARLLVHNYYKVGRYQKALKVIDETLQRWQKYNLPFGKILKQELYYWNARILMRRGNFGQAARLLAKSVELAEALPRTQYREYYAAAAYYAGLAFMYTGKTKRAIPYFKAASYTETEGVYSEMARNQLEQIKEQQ